MNFTRDTTFKELLVTEDENSRQKAVDYARATSELAGVKFSPETEALMKRFVDGEITIETAIAISRARWGLPTESSN